ncbi:hypothetical protein LFYK43_12110 [Ligilactobacillus salitolerans]|uniref:Plasmid pRiA4b Orf3-like domain-containing protein n=1 Tax=Ligilactobacillus salitolerans TaxID=1808352 RepID=A0A401IT99_9LACO|nr:plasmid pRiA4b ORF-3 family protein [Ligilactobacillus salitolerans]GBG94752.1 hypothetical protein LFYK43_12110 [Ligilactobacillus salitolerans]
MAEHNVYRFYAELADYEPKNWWRFEINGEKTMAELAYSILLMFEMQASHLFSLTDYRRETFKEWAKAELGEENSAASDYLANLKNTHYEIAFDDVYLQENEELVKPDEVTLNQELGGFTSRLELAYDYGDDWKVELYLEDSTKKQISLKDVPRVIEGEGFGIIEDVGGVTGLRQLAQILKQGHGAEYDDMARWLDSTTLDLQSFDQEDMNFRLKKLVRVYREAYEDGLEPTARSYKLLTRDYLGKGSRGY